jgi:DNA-binding transcriptional MerR regulator
MDERRDHQPPPFGAAASGDRDEHDPAAEPGDRSYGLAELAETAGVSIRTVRYYIGEGLLPPPASAGPRSAYTPGHLDRLRLIGRLKDAYLPLREIRRRLDGLDDAAVRALLARLGPPAARGSAEEGDDEPPRRLDSAASYLARVMGPRSPAAGSSPRVLNRLVPPPSPPASAAPPGAPPAVPSHPVGDRAPWAEQDDEGIAGATMPEPPAWSAPIAAATAPGFASWPDPDLELDPALALLPPPPAAVPEPAVEGAWRRIPLGPDAELLVREDAYRRRRDRIDWLVAWARKVFT